MSVVPARAWIVAALLALLLAVPAAAQGPALEAAKEEAGPLPAPVAQFTTPVGRLALEHAELLAARQDQPVRFTLTLDRDVERGVLRIALPRRWREVPGSGLRPSTAPRGRAIGRATDAVEIVLDGAAAGDELSAELRDRGIPAGTYALPVTLSEGGGPAERIGRLEVVFYARTREGDEQPWRDVRAIQVSDAPFDQNETFVSVVPGNPNRLIAGANGGVRGYSAWISDDGGESWVERVLPANTPGAPGPVSGTASLSNCCDPMSAADAAGNLWYGGLDDTPDSHIVVGRVPAGSTAFVNAVALPARTSGTQDKPMMTIDNHPSSPTFGRLYVVWNEPSGGGINVVVSFCDSRPGGVANVARCDVAANWTAPATVTKGGAGSFIYADVAVAPDGRAYVVWWNYSAANAIEGASCAPGANCATAGGWSSTTKIATLDQTGSAPVPFECPILAQPGGRASPAPNVEVARSDGRVYVAWSDLRTGSGTTRCAEGVRPAATHLRFDSLVKSAPAGSLPAATASATRLLTDAEDPNSDDWFPWLAVDQSTGAAYAALYSTREDGTRHRAHFYARALGAAGQLGPLVRVSDAASDYSTAPCCGFGNDYGDYAGLDATGGVAYPIWSDRSTFSGEAVLDAVILPPPGAQALMQPGAASVDDAAPGGDADGVPEPGETLTVTIPVENAGTATARTATGTLTSTNPKVSLPRAEAAYGDVGAGSSASASYSVHLAGDLGCGASPVLRLRVGHAGGAVLERYAVRTGGAAESTSASDVPKPVPDAISTSTPGQATSSLTMPAAGRVGDVDVRVSLTHPFVGDVSLVLAHPDGTQVPLTTRAGNPTSGADNFNGTVFDDEAPTLLGGPAGFTGRFRPEDPLAVLDGKPWAGTWTLTVLDGRAGNTGTLTGWALERRTCSAPATNQPPVAAISGPDAGTVGQPLGFSAAASTDPDGTIARYDWDLDGDGAFETATGTTPVAEAVFADAGIRTVRVRVTDGAGATADAAVAVTISVPAAAAPPAVPPSGSIAPFVALGRPGATLRARRGRFGVDVRGCAGCRGTLVLETARKVRATRTSRPRKVRLARVRFTIAASGTVVVRVRLTRSGRSLLKRLRRVALTARLSATDAAGRTVSTSGRLTLRR